MTREGEGGSRRDISGEEMETALMFILFIYVLMFFSLLNCYY